jgi:DNA-binding NtrC family response regulator
MQAVYRQLELLLSGRMPVLVTGETGVGKEHVVRILHASSDRGDGPLEVVNCAAIPSELLEAELFGIEEGIATGVKAREGCFRRAYAGIVFLDEIGDMPPALQAAAHLQDGEVHRWARRPARIDVRVVTATTPSWRRGCVRELPARPHYRIGGCRSTCRRQRAVGGHPAPGGALPRALGAETGRRSAFSVAALAPSRAAWPGNVRELENEVRRLCSLPDGRASRAM